MMQNQKEKKRKAREEREGREKMYIFHSSVAWEFLCFLSSHILPEHTLIRTSSLLKPSMNVITNKKCMREQSQ